MNKNDKTIKVIDAAKLLLAKMNKIYMSGEYKGVWVLARNHGMPYNGEKWDKEEAKLQEAITDWEGDANGQNLGE